MGAGGGGLGVIGVEGGSMVGDDRVFKGTKAKPCRVNVTSLLLSRTADLLCSSTEGRSVVIRVATSQRGGVWANLDTDCQK